MSTLADIARSLSNKTLSRNELKVIRARLRRMGVTNKTDRASGPYTINPSIDAPTDIRAEAGTVIVSCVAEAL